MLLALVGCGRADASGLRAASAESCAPDAYLLSLPPGHAFVLNSETRDSAGISTWLRDVLPKRSGTGRYVNVDAAASRGRDLAWLLPAIKHSGGEAFARDTACHIAIPSRAAR